MNELTSNELDFLARPLHGVLATQDAWGKIYSVPVNSLVEETIDGSQIFILASKSSKKARNAAGGCPGSLCVFEGPRYVTVAGSLAVSEEAEVRHRAELAYQQKYSKMPRHNPQRVIIVMKVERVVSRGLGS